MDQLFLMSTQDQNSGLHKYSLIPSELIKVEEDAAVASILENHHHTHRPRSTGTTPPWLQNLKDRKESRLPHDLLSTFMPREVRRSPEDEVTVTRVPATEHLSAATSLLNYVLHQRPANPIFPSPQPCTTLKHQWESSSSPPLGSDRCPHCKESFASSHQCPPCFTCSICFKTFSDRTAFTRHSRTHDNPVVTRRKYGCEECGRQFVDSCGLKKHKRSHTGEKPYVCDICGKAFSASSTFTSHRRIHTGERPYPCESCDKAFVTKSHLSTHKRTHTGERPYSCGVCARAFADGSSFRRHERLHSHMTRPSSSTGVFSPPPT